ncbi:MAG: endonuclease VIII [Gammaproteobacteria bacterium]|jgi:endonuclease-8|nr:endonuclease VIII [Chromatiales bacterium]MDP6674899.1 endonuclease VIII [Gammaproteobacteria bacterium]
MPEGPEIRRAADQISAALAGKSLEKVFFAPGSFPKLARRSGELIGQHVLHVDTHGKAMLTRLDGGQTIYSHNQLYGRWRVCPRGTLPDTKRSLRLALHTADQSALLYSASEIELLSVDEQARHPYLSRLGPDALNRNLDWTMLRDRTISPEFRRRSLAALYVDQHYLAGLGDYLRSEILFAARLNPWSKPGELSAKELSRLSRQTLGITQRSYRTGGLTNPPRLITRLRAEWLSTHQRPDPETGDSVSSNQKARVDKEAIRFAVFRRGGEPCYTCDATIERVNVSGRALYYCPVCQGK